MVGFALLDLGKSCCTSKRERSKDALTLNPLTGSHPDPAALIEAVRVLAASSFASETGQDR
jgi:hypothetical protein